MGPNGSAENIKKFWILLNFAELELFARHYSRESDFFFKNLDGATSKRHFTEFPPYKSLILTSSATIWKLSSKFSDKVKFWYTLGDKAFTKEPDSFHVATSP